MNTKIVLIGTLLLLFQGAATAQQYYRWVDADGTVHFSESPPPEQTDASLEEIRESHLTRGMGGMNTGSGEADEAVAAGENPNAAPVNQTPGSTTNEEMCEKVQANLQTLRTNPQVRRVDPDTGEVRMMTTEEHQAELERTLALEEQYC